MYCGLWAARLGASDKLGSWELGSAPLWDFWRRPKVKGKAVGLCPTPYQGDFLGKVPLDPSKTFPLARRKVVRC